MKYTLVPGEKEYMTIMRTAEIVRATFCIVISGCCLFALLVFAQDTPLQSFKDRVDNSLEHRLTVLETNAIDMRADMVEIKNLLWIACLGVAALTGEAGIRAARKNKP